MMTEPKMLLENKDTFELWEIRESLENLLFHEIDKDFHLTLMKERVDDILEERGELILDDEEEDDD